MRGRRAASWPREAVRLSAARSVAVVQARDAAIGQLRADVAAFPAATTREIASRTRFLAELDRLGSPFSRDADPVHVTASAIVLGRRGTVLHLHKKLNRWLQPGGHLEPGETAPEAALREAGEETGLRVRHVAAHPRLLHLDVHPAGGHVHLDLRYVLNADDADPVPPPGESPHARWFSLAEALALADDALIDALRRAEALLG